MLKACWKYRLFIITSIRNELTSNFKKSSIGSVWIILNPLSQVLIYSLVLSKVISAKLSTNTNPYAYAIYLMAGLLSWNLFQEILVKSSNIFLNSSQYLKKMQFPRSTIPAILYGSSILNNVLLFFSILFIALILKYPLDIGVFVIPFLSLLLGLFSLSIGIILGILNVFIRDISQLLPIILQLWFWFTPIVYPESIVPEYILKYIKINPIYLFVKMYQDLLCVGTYPSLAKLFFLVLSSLFLSILAIKFYRKSVDEIVDAI